MSKDSHRRVFYVPSLFTTCCAQEKMAVLQEKRGPALCMTLRGQTPTWILAVSLCEQGTTLHSVVAWGVGGGADMTSY